jgi:hypothetical protein
MDLRIGENQWCSAGQEVRVKRASVGSVSMKTGLSKGDICLSRDPGVVTCSPTHGGRLGFGGYC